MNRLKQLNHNQIRYLLLPFLALALVHFVSYGKLPWDEGYQFPLAAFLSVFLICVCCCEANSFSYHRLSKKLSISREPVKTITIQVATSLVLTSLIFAITVYSINFIVFGHVSNLSQFISSLFIALLIIAVETLAFIIRDLRKDVPQPEIKEPSNIFMVNSGQRTLRISESDIAYVFSKTGVVYVVTTSGEKILTQFNSLNELSENNNTSDFFRLNRQFMVKLGAIKEIQRDINQKLRVSLEPTATNIPEEATVSRYTSPAFKRWLKQ